MRLVPITTVRLLSLNKSLNCQYPRLTRSIVFTGKDSSRALAQSSLKVEDCTPEWEDLGDSEKKVLNDWFTFFSKRYNIVGRVAKAENL